MTKRRPSSSRAAQGAPEKGVATGDSFQNLAARVGLGAGSQNDASRYAFSPVSRNRVEIEYAYRSSWIAGQAVDTFADDMTREGIVLAGDVEPDRIEEIEKAADRLGVWNSLNDLAKWSRLYGGAIAVILVDGQKPETPLRADTVGKGQFRGLLVLDRWVVQPTLTDVVEELGPELGMPRFYDVLADAKGMTTMRIHHSRVVRLDGVDLPYWQKIAENGWGQSVLERLWDRLVSFDSATMGAAQLIYKAHLRTYKVEGLRDIIAVGGKAFEGLVKQIEMIRKFQSNEGLTLMDSKDEFETHQYSFSGLSDMLLQLGQQLSGALGIPLVRLFGQSPAGLNSTGESDLRNYYDNVKQQQERKLRTGVGKIYDVLHRSLFGEPPPPSFDFDFRPLWQLSDTEKSSVAVNTTQAVTAAFDSGLVDRATALKELRQNSRITGVFSNITDEDIKEAEEEPPPTLGEAIGDPNDATDPNGRPGPEAAGAEKPPGSEEPARAARNAGD